MSYIHTIHGAMQKKDTPLSVAAEHGKVKVVRVLISLGADVNKTLKDMVSVLLVGWSCLVTTLVQFWRFYSIDQHHFDCSAG